jgi:hypothetical protein
MELVWSGDGTGNLIGSINAGEPVISISIDSAGDYIVTLHKSIDHAPGANEFSYAFSVDVSDGVETVPASLNLTIVDSVPIVDVQYGFGGNFSGTEIIGDLVDFGADFNGTQIDLSGSITALQALGLTSSGQPISYALSNNGATITATAAGNTVFVMAANTDGSYQFTINKSIDSFLFDSQGLAPGSSNNFYIHSDGTLVDTDSTREWLQTVRAENSNGTANTVEWNNNEITVGNNRIENGQKLIFDFDNQGVSGGADNGTYAAFTFGKQGNKNAALNYTWTTLYTDGTSATGSSSAAQLSIATPTGKLIDQITIEVTVGRGIVTDYKFGAVQEDVVNLPFEFDATDADGDVINGTVDISLAGTEVVDSSSLTAGNDYTLTSGDDTLLISSADLSTLESISGGAGTDTVKFNEDGQVITAEQINASFEGGFEIIDMTAFGSNELLLDFEGVLSLSEGSELNLTLDGEGGQEVSVLKIVGDAEDTVSIQSKEGETWEAVDSSATEGQVYKFTSEDASAPVYVQIVDVPVIDVPVS